MQFKGFTLDKFQEDAINSIDKHNSVVVSAATGTGKTLVADYVIDKFLHSGQKIIYTAPIKALSNQKFKDFCKDHGKENVGIMTGDIVINPQAPILIMTTEIYRNMLLSKDNSLEQVTYVIFDEIHFISDRERGSVWEESIIFSSKKVRFLCLSATIPNAKEFAGWIQKIKNHTVEVVSYDKRAVPLKHLFFDKQLGVTTIKKLKELDKLSEYNTGRKRGSNKRRGWGGRFNPPNHYDLINDIKDKLPALFFIFNRKECEIKSRELAKYHDFSKKNEKTEIIKVFQEHINGEIATMQTTRRLREIIHKGIAFHHAGLLPQLKEVVEILFSKGLIKVLYCTETFAVGINMPARSACFYNLEKYDGINFRFLTRHEYFQLAGRAGRRGIDTVGYAISLYDRNYYPIKKLEELIEGEAESIISQFKLSINSVLNLIKNHKPKDREKILKMNFDYYLKQHDEKQIRIKASYNNRIKKLTAMNYLQGDNLTEKGFFACRIYNDELLITEIFNSNIAEELTNKQLLILLAGIEYEDKRKDYFSIKGTEGSYGQMIKVLNKNNYVIRNVNQKNLKRMIAIVSTWYDQGSFQDLTKLTNLMEGDIIRLFRRIIDMLRQVNAATSDRQLQYRMEELMHKIDRGLIEAKI